MDSFKLHPGGYNEEPGIYVEETGKASGNLQDKELENLRQLLEYETRLEKLGQQLRKEKKDPRSKNNVRRKHKDG